MTKKLYNNYPRMRLAVLFELSKLYDADEKRIKYLAKSIGYSFSPLPSDFTTISTPQLASALGYARPTPNLYRALYDLRDEGKIYAEYVGETNTGHDTYEWRLFTPQEAQAWTPECKME